MNQWVSVYATTDDIAARIERERDEGQSKLTRLAKTRAQQDESNLWRDAFQSCADVVHMFYA